MSSEDWVELHDISVRFLGYSDISLKKIKQLYSRAKEIFNNRLPYLRENDLRLLLSIFKSSFDRVSRFWQKWQKGEITPTDEELDLLEEAFNEVSLIFNSLANLNLNNFSAADNQKFQAVISKNKEIISQEKDKRKRGGGDNPNLPQQEKPTKNISQRFPWKKVIPIMLVILLVGLVILIYRRLKK